MARTVQGPTKPECTKQCGLVFNHTGGEHRLDCPVYAWDHPPAARTRMVQSGRFIISPSANNGVPLWARERLYEALRKLRVWESELVDLEYPEGDPRRLKHESELPQEWHDERATLRETAVFNAALIGGEDEHTADCYADQPLSEANPYNVYQVQRAVAIFRGWKGWK